MAVQQHLAATNKELDMKRLFLAVLLGIVAAAVAPVASASAAETVKCKFEGTAGFETALGFTPTVGLDVYTFTSAGTNECNGKKASVSLKGAGHLSCSV